MYKYLQIFYKKRKSCRKATIYPSILHLPVLLSHSFVLERANTKEGITVSEFFADRHCNATGSSTQQVQLGSPALHTHLQTLQGPEKEKVHRGKNA